MNFFKNSFLFVKRGHSTLQKSWLSTVMHCPRFWDSPACWVLLQCEWGKVSVPTWKSYLWFGGGICVCVIAVLPPPFLSDFPDSRNEILNLFIIYGIMQCSVLQKCSFEHNNGLKMTLTAITPTIIHKCCYKPRYHFYSQTNASLY